MAPCGETHSRFKALLLCKEQQEVRKGQLNTQCLLADQLVSQDRQVAESQTPEVLHISQEKTQCEVTAATLGYSGREQNSRKQAGNTWSPEYTYELPPVTASGLKDGISVYL